MHCFNHSSGEHLQIGDAKVYYETSGSPDGVPLVVLHGGLGNIMDLNPVIASLPNSYFIVGIDFRGHGKSELGKMPMTFERYQSDVISILSHMAIVKYSILGFSVGGIVGYRLAASYPNKVQSLISVAGNWDIQEDSPEYERLKSVTSGRWSKMFPDSVAYYNSINPSPDFDVLVKSVVKLWCDLGASGYPKETISQITAPTLIVRGDKDHLCSLDNAVEACSRIKDANFLNIPFAGHEAFKDSPDVFSSLLSEFYDTAEA